MLRGFDHLIFLSEQQDRRRFYDHWLAQRLGINNRSILPNGVWLGELERRQPDFRQEYGIQNRYVLLNVANYCDRKNQLAALRAFLKLIRDDVAIVFIGSQFNEYSEEMKRLCRQHPGRSVFILQQLPRPLIYGAYQSADVFLLPSKDETQPLALLEAMACGVPFVSTPVGCVREFPGGIIAETEAQFVTVINDLLNKSEKRRILGEAGRTAVREHYSWESILGKYELLFSKLMRGESAGPAEGSQPGRANDN